MRTHQSMALEAAREITVAALQGGGDHSIDSARGTATADFFEAVYRKILALASEAEN